MSGFDLAFPPPGFAFSPEFREWLLCDGYEYDLMRLHEMYPDVPEFNYHPPTDEWDANRLKDCQTFEKATGLCAFAVRK